MPETIQVRLARLDFQNAVTRDLAGTPRIDAELAAEQGARVLLVDVREPEELIGSLGFIPSSRSVPLSRITEVLRLGTGARVVLVSREGRRAGVAARMLEMAGMGYVAALEGGMLAWRGLGLPATRSVDAIDDTLPADVDAPLRMTERAERRLSLDEVREHVGTAHNVHWVKLAAFLLHGKTACVDGRDSHGVIGAPGGDAGEFLLALAAAERLGQAVGAETIPDLLDAWIDAFGKFYLHSDIPALNRFIAAMRADPRIPEESLPLRTDPASAWRKFTRTVPGRIRPFVLEHLRHPDHMGCGHLKLSMLHGDDYGVRRELIEGFFQAFFEAVWSGIPELSFVALGGGHQEGGVLLVRTEGDIHPYTRIPLVPPSIGGTQVFVHHPQVTAYQRDAIAHWMCSRPELPALHGKHPGLAAEIVRIGETQMGHTLGHLAKGLPIFEAVYAQNRSVRVEQVGEV